MKLIETTITDKSVRMRYADNEDAAAASEWIDFQVPLAKLEHAEKTALGDPEMSTQNRRWRSLRIAQTV
jgi:hypothetical protein